MEINPDTFCAAPWFHIRNQQNGAFRPCCDHDAALSEFPGRKNFSWPHNDFNEYVNSEYLQYLRQQLTTGHRLPECSSCWKKEKMGQTSLRQVINNTMTKNQGHALDQTWIASYGRRKRDFTHDYIISADIKLSNHCNFACAMCWPHDSTKIYSAWKSKSDHKIMPILQAHRPPGYLDDIRNRAVDNHNYDLLDQILAQNPRYLKILGGEPLLDRELLKKLQETPESVQQKLSLIFSTNGSVDLVDFAKSLSRFKQVQYVVSLDGIDQTQDYIRKGSDWSSIARNIESWLERGNRLDVHCTLQSLNLLRLPQLMTWCEDRNINIDYSWVDQPYFFSVTSIPSPIRQLISDSLSNHDSWRNPNNQSIHGNVLDFFSEYPHNPKHTNDLYDFLDWFDDKGLWQKVMPEWVR